MGFFDSISSILGTDGGGGGILGSISDALGTSGKKNVGLLNDPTSMAVVAAVAAYYGIPAEAVSGGQIATAASEGAITAGQAASVASAGQAAGMEVGALQGITADTAFGTATSSTGLASLGGSVNTAGAAFGAGGGTIATDAALVAGSGASATSLTGAAMGGMGSMTAADIAAGGATSLGGWSGASDLTALAAGGGAAVAAGEVAAGGATAATAAGGLGTLGTIANGLAGAGALASGIAGLSQAGKIGDPTAAANAADPFASQRAQYQKQLSDLMKDPSSITKSPTYAAGMQAVERSEASQGYAGSGKAATDIAAFGATAYTDQLKTLMDLSGVNAGSPATAGSITQSAGVNQANLTGQSLNSLAYGTSLIGQAFNPTPVK